MGNEQGNVARFEAACDRKSIEVCVAPTALGNFGLWSQPLRAGLTYDAATALGMWRRRTWQIRDTADDKIR
jgi:hypothetical protein